MRVVFNKIKEIYKKDKLTFICCVITFIIGFLFAYSFFCYPIKISLIILIARFLPFFLLLIVLILKCCIKNKYIETFFRILRDLILLMLLPYYFVSIFVVAVLETENPVTDTKCYKCVTVSRLYQAFPKNIPDSAENVSFYYAPGFLQGGTNYMLYYVDKTITLEKFDSKYRSKSEWIGTLDEYDEKEGLFGGAFSYTPDDINEDDFIIYLISSRCDDSGYCNHGEFLFASFNPNTNELVFRAEYW